MRRRHIAASAATLVAAVVVGTVGAGGAQAAAGAVTYGQQEQLAAGVNLQDVTVQAANGVVHGHVITVDLRDPHVRTDLLTPGTVASRAAVSQLADTRHAVAAVNGDFFNIDENENQHPGVTATGSSVGPEIGSGRQLKAAVPDAQRFGPGMPKGETTRDVIGVGTDRRARLGTLTLHGRVRTPAGTYPLGGYNQYALPVGGIGAYTADWGATSRARAVCGSDTSRAAGCSTDTYEVAVRAGRVVSVADTPGAGAVPRGTTVLVGRDGGADTLRTLRPGDRVRVEQHLAPSATDVPYAFAVGGFPVLRAGAPLAGLDDRTAATRTAAGFGDQGRTLRLLALDGGSETGSGLTIAELATVMGELGCDNAVNLDGGGSTTMVARDPGAAAVTVRSHPLGGIERPVPNGIGIFATR